MRYNPDKITTLASALKKALYNLQQLQKLTKKEFLSDADKVASAKYNFIVAIEAAIDIASHIIAKNALRAPLDYADTFAVLAEAGCYSSDFAQELKDMARFRNRLVHLYWEVSDERVYEFLQNKLNDLTLFLQKIFTFIGL